MNGRPPAHRREQHILTTGQQVVGAQHSWKVGNQLARPKEHVRRASRIDPPSSQRINSVIKTTEVHSTPKAVARFRDELNGMVALTDRGAAGVLPVLDWPQDKGDLWYVMPTARPLADELAGANFEVVVRAVASLADTLDALSRPSATTSGPRAVAHRDIKPENLFWYDGGPVLADFGIAAWFDDTATPTVTKEGESVGPRNFMAPEARFYNDGIDWHRADVYSLALTFWSLAERRHELRSGKKIVKLPPLGSISVSDERVSMARFGGPDATTLDALMELATSSEPGDRPSAAEFRDELRTWLNYYPGPHPRPRLLLRTGMGPIKRILDRMRDDQNLFLDVLRAEARKALGTVEFDDTVAVDFKPRGQLGRDGQPRTNTVMDPFHGRSDHDEWDGSLVVALRSSDDASRLVMGGTFDVAGRVDWIAESHRHTDGCWELVASADEVDLVIGLLTTRKIIRDFLETHRPTNTHADRLSWIAERVL